MKHLTISILTMLTATTLSAQKLPNKQEGSLRAPANVNIDGKASEWGNQFKAYNAATGIFYTIANNNEELFLVVNAKSPDVINKIMVGGLTLTVKTNKATNSFTFPAYDANSTSHLDFSLTRTEEKTAEEIEAMITKNNRIQKGKHKLIKVKSGTTDTLISIYNDSGIRVAALFDAKNSYTLEMAVNLKQIGLSVQNSNTFPYQVKLNGERFSPIVLAPVQANGLSPTAEQKERYERANERLAQLVAANDFWSEYTLAK